MFRFLWFLLLRVGFAWLLFFIWPVFYGLGKLITVSSGWPANIVGWLILGLVALLPAKYTFDRTMIVVGPYIDQVLGENDPIMPLKRWFDGRAAMFIVLGTFTAGFLYYLWLFSQITPDMHKTLMHLVTKYEWVQAAVVLMTAWAAHGVIIQDPGLISIMAKKTLTTRDYFRHKNAGAGGSSKFAEFWREWDYPFSQGSLYLGRSLYGYLHVGIDDDRHMLTIAGTRSGKGISVIIPNLLLWPHNLICLDPKLENLYRTGRNSMRKPVFVIDPFKKVQGFDDRQVTYNPLAEINPHSPDASRIINAIVDALIVPMGDRNKFWDESSIDIIGGLIAHVVSAPEYEGRRNLVTVYDLMTQTVKDSQELFTAMQNNPRCSGLPVKGSSAISKCKGETGGNIEGNVACHLKWLKDPRIQTFLSGESGFSMFDITHKPMSIYLCIEGTALHDFNRFMRIFFRLGLFAAENPRVLHPRIKCLYLMDEFYSLGYFPIIKNNVNYFGSLGIKLWPIVQYVGQLKELYGESWRSFESAAAAVQVFAQDDDDTLEFIARKLGDRRVMMKTGEREKEGKFSNETMFGTQSFDKHALLTPQEIKDFLDRDKGRCFVFPAGSNETLVLNRINYDQLFHPDMYSPDPAFPLSAGKTLMMKLFGWTRTKYFGSKSSILNPGRKKTPEPLKKHEIDEMTIGQLQQHYDAQKVSLPLHLQKENEEHARRKQDEVDEVRQKEAIVLQNLAAHTQAQEDQEQRQLERVGREKREHDQAMAEIKGLVKEKEAAVIEAQRVVKEVEQHEEERQRQEKELREEEAQLAALPKGEPFSLEMTQEEARVFLKYELTDIFTAQELDTRYDDVSAATDSKAMQSEIDTAYQVLKDYLKEQKEAAYLEERSKFDFGPTDIITKVELRKRYELASEKTDSKVEQKILDDAYQVLLKIAV